MGGPFSTRGPVVPSPPDMSCQMYDVASSNFWKQRVMKEEVAKHVAVVNPITGQKLGAVPATPKAQDDDARSEVSIRSSASRMSGYSTMSTKKIAELEARLSAELAAKDAAVAEAAKLKAQIQKLPSGKNQ